MFREQHCKGDKGEPMSHGRHNSVVAGWSVVEIAVQKEIIVPGEVRDQYDTGTYPELAQLAAAESDAVQTS